MAREVTEGEDIIDSRDVIARIEELESEREDFISSNSDTEEEQAQAIKAASDEWDEGDDGQELAALKALAEEASGSPDWHHGETLVADHYFEEYAQELAEDIGATSYDAAWPYTCIDWKQAAEELQQDYTSVEFGSITYWVRS